MTSVRQDAWKQDEDLLLSEVVLRYIREGELSSWHLRTAYRKHRHPADFTGIHMCRSNTQK
ncbi:hypothetical protein PTHTG4_17490 [Parageobacillus thermoglucosidasius]|nr:hypothetical protein PTHTG4_17490 [Parageobacillus thermoglucosidasius]